MDGTAMIKHIIKNYDIKQKQEIAEFKRNNEGKKPRRSSFYNANINMKEGNVQNLTSIF